jgi:hypothetical protein
LDLSLNPSPLSMFPQSLFPNVPSGSSVPAVGLPYLGFSGLTEEEIQGRTLELLARELNKRKVVAFVGNGVSSGMGYPSWLSLASKSIWKSDLQDFDKSRLVKFFDKNSASENIPLQTGDQILAALHQAGQLLEAGGFGRFSIQKRASKIIREHASKGCGELMERTPLSILVDELRIRRFITTNYDSEIMKALEKRKDIEKDKPPLKVLEPDTRAYEELVKFGISAPGYETGVFHCHGHMDNPERMILTEDDYQRLYFRNTASHQAYRAAIDLAFRGNSLLFIGCGFSEEDLLRPLRRF